MMPTVWSLFFESDEMTPDVTLRLRHGAKLHDLRTALEGTADDAFLISAEKSFGDALRQTLDVPVIDVLLCAWRDHPGLTSVQREPGDETILLVDLGEHEITSIHQPRIDVMSPPATIASFQFDLRLELMVQRAALQIGENNHVLRVSMGACSGTGSLSLAGHELTRFACDDIRFPEEILFDAPVTVPAAEPEAGQSRLGIRRWWRRK